MHLSKILLTQDSKGDTALNLACCVGNLEIVQLLLAKGANTVINFDAQGMNCFHAKAEFSDDLTRINTFDILCDYTVAQKRYELINAKDKSDKAPIHYVLE